MWFCFHSALWFPLHVWPYRRKLSCSLTFPLSCRMDRIFKKENSKTWVSIQMKMKWSSWNDKRIRHKNARLHWRYQKCFNVWMNFAEWQFCCAQNLFHLDTSEYQTFCLVRMGSRLRRYHCLLSSLSGRVQHFWNTKSSTMATSQLWFLFNVCTSTKVILLVRFMLPCMFINLTEIYVWISQKYLKWKSMNIMEIYNRHFTILLKY